MPLGQVDPDLVRNLVQYYRDEYGLGIGVLTPSAVPAGMSNPDREQIDGASLATYLGTLFPADFDDPNVALIGLTPLDLYAEERDWRFQLGNANWSEHSRAVVSTYRMHLRTFGPRDDELVFSRTRTLVTKSGLDVLRTTPERRPQEPNVRQHPERDRPRRDGGAASPSQPLSGYSGEGLGH